MALDDLEFSGPPTTRQQLDLRVAAIADTLGIPARRATVMVSSIVVAQMLPDGAVVKGGIGVKLRLGEVGTRATRDIDLVTRNVEDFLVNLKQRLETGWGTVPASKGQLKKQADSPPRLAFTGVAKTEKRATPAGVPAEYVMQPYRVTLSFLGSAWASVPLEVAHDELDGIDYAEQDHDVADQLVAIAAVLGFGDLSPVPLISLEQQIAQKVHAATAPLSDRAHDLVDLQLLWAAGTDGGENLDLSLLRSLCERTFTYRKGHVWPPATATMSTALDEAYRVALEEARTEPDLAVAAGARANNAPVLADDLSGATAWLDDRIAEVAASGPQP